MADIPRVKWVETDPDDEDSRGYITDPDGGFEVMPWELVDSYNRLADQLEWMVKHGNEG